MPHFNSDVQMAKDEITDGTLQYHDELVAALFATLNKFHCAVPDAAEQSRICADPVLHLEAADDEAPELQEQQIIVYQDLGAYGGLKPILDGVLTRHNAEHLPTRMNLVLYQEVLEHLLHMSELQNADRVKCATQYDVEYEFIVVLFGSMALGVYSNAIWNVCAKHRDH